ncbi:MAG TPA: carboxypeptidase-like regulatory domain-containing protein [Candidatus Binataceae bacterium]|nr:carboxypeptidase-like regulatory domain-containing protein [Candidatus Binataceae bacterium]
MTKVGLGLLVGVIFAVALAMPANAISSTAPAALTKVVGIVNGPDGKPVAGVQINAVDKVTGKVIAHGVTGADGRYVISGIIPDRVYVLKLDPLATGVKAGDAVAYIGPDGLTSDWNVSTAADAFDQAIAGVGGGLGSFGAGAGIGTLGALGIGLGATGAVLGGTLGGIAASGGFSSSSPASPSK